MRTKKILSLFLIIMLLFFECASYASDKPYLDEQTIRSNAKDMKKFDELVVQYINYIDETSFVAYTIESLNKLIEITDAYIAGAGYFSIFGTYANKYEENYAKIESIKTKIEDARKAKMLLEYGIDWQTKLEKGQITYESNPDKETNGENQGIDITEDVQIMGNKEVAKDMYVSKNTNIYQLADGNYTKGELIKWGTKVHVLYEQADGWCYINSPQTGYIKKEYLSTSKPEASSYIEDFDSSGVIIGDLGSSPIVDPTNEAGANTYNPYTSSSALTDANSSKLLNLGKTVIGIVNVIATVVAVLVLTLLGIKYMMGSIEEKAEYKETMMPYIVGAIFVFSSTTIVNLIYNFAMTFNN